MRQYNAHHRHAFIGRKSLENIIKKPLEKQLDLFSLRYDFNPGEPLLLHDEPIYFKNKLVGSTTSSNYSFCYKKNICLAYVKNGIDKDDLQIEVEGKRYSLKLEKNPIHDPNSSLMRN